MRIYFKLNKNQQNSRFALKIDWCLLLLLIAICVFGLVILYSASGKNSDLVFTQLRSLALGFCCMIVVAQFNPRLWLSFVPVFYMIGVMLLLAVDFAGHNAMGATRWINIAGIVRFQPAEFMKVLMPAMIAWQLSKKPLPPSFISTTIALILIAIPVVLVIRQPDLGTALLILTSGIFVLFIAGLNWYLIGVSLLFAIPGVIAMWHFVMHDYQKRRVLTFLNPESDPLGAGWNIIQSKTAIGSGGIWGKGYLNGTQSQLDFLPESHTDFIVAVLGEEFGLVGMSAIMMLYLLLIWRCLVIASNAHQLFGKLLACSLILTFFIYIFVNIGMVSGLLPVVGVPLPFISYGGTHVVTLLMGFGIIMAVYVYGNEIKIDE